MIREVVDQNGVTLKTGEEIKVEAERYFREFLAHEPEDYRGMTVDEPQGLLDF